MYDILPSFILGFHGCDRETADRVIGARDHLKPSKNEYDWLGHGIYFWENNPQRALHWAHRRMSPQRGQKRVRQAAVVGAVIDLGRCLNLLDAEFIHGMKAGYAGLKTNCKQSGLEMPRNRRLGGSTDLLLRNLDCAVIEWVHASRRQEESPAFQSVRGVFVEGSPIYPGAGVHEFNHIQVCVRDPRCIKGYFHVLGEPGSPKIARK